MKVAQRAATQTRVRAKPKSYAKPTTGPKPKTGMTWAKQFNLPITDAEAPLIAEVIPSDIKKGVPGDQRKCPIAVSLQRVYEADAWIGSVFAYVVWPKEGWVERFRVPDRTSRQEVVVDHGGQMATGEMVLAPVPPSMRRGARAAAREKNGDENGNGKRPKPARQRIVAKIEGDRTRRG
jgi:hypothetical protein